MPEKELRSARQALRYYLTDHVTPQGKLFDVAFLLLNVVFAGLYVAETYDLPPHLADRIWQLEVWIAVVFLGEYLLRLFAAKDRIAFATDIYSIADILAIAPTLLLAFGPLGAPLQAGFLKILRVLRIFRFYRLTRNRKYFFGTVSVQTLQILKFALTIITIFFISAGLFHSVEAASNPEIANFGDAFYYMVVALTTVGFGDIIPHTQGGRLITITTIVVAYIAIPYHTTQIARRWLSKGKIEVTCDTCGQEKHAADASYCKQCGSPLFEDDEGGSPS